MQKDEIRGTGTTWTIAAFLMAPFVVAVAMAFWEIPSNRYDFITGLVLMPVFYFFAALPSMILGMPAYLILKRLNRLNICTILASGAVIGSISAVLLRLPNMPEANDFGVCLTLGSLGSLAFWVCWSRAHV